MKPTPKGWPRLSAAIFYDDAAGAIDWLCRAFGFEVRLKVEGDGGRIEHSELVYGEALVMVSQSGEKPARPKLPRGASPRVRLGRPNSKNPPFTITALTTGRTGAMERSISKAISGGSLSEYGI